MAFTIKQPVMFKHCDAAGIVFYPRYFEMINDCVEVFFDRVLHYPFARMHPDAGIPTVQLDTTFTAPSRLGDVLDLTLRCQHLGRTSLGFSLAAECAGETRLSAQQTIVHVDKNGKPQPWPDAIRARLDTELEAAT